MISSTIETALIAIVLSQATPPAAMYFGREIDANEQRIVVSSWVGNKYNSRVDLFVPAGTSWRHACDVTPPGPPIDGMGEFVRLAGDGLLVGNGARQEGIGCVYYSPNPMERSAKRKWTQLAPSEKVREGHFGDFMAVGPGALIISAPSAAVPRAPIGVVYVFREQETGWNEVQKITADYPPAQEPLWFGESLALDEHLLAIGAPGAETASNKRGGVVFLYVPDPDRGFVPATPPFVSISDDRSVLFLAGQIAMNKHWLIVAASEANDGQGAVYAWQRDEHGQIDEQPTLRLVDPEGRADDHFGDAVALTDSSVCVGSHFHAVNGLHHSGTVCVYRFGEGSMLPEVPSQRLVAPRVSESALFGGEVATAGATIVVSARGEQNNRAVYLYEPDGAVYSAAVRFSPTDGVESLKRRRSR